MGNGKIEEVTHIMYYQCTGYAKPLRNTYERLGCSFTVISSSALPLTYYGRPPLARYLFEDDAFIGTEIGAADLLKKRDVGPEYIPKVYPCIRMILAVLPVPHIPSQNLHAITGLV